MRTRWMIVGSLLTLAAIAVVVVWGGVVLAQQGPDEATPEPSAAEDASAPSGFGDHVSGLVKGLRGDELGDHGPIGHRPIGRHAFEIWHHAGDHGFDWLAEVIGISPDELREALADGQTLAEIAEANGMTREELIDALLAEAEEGLAVAVEAGLLDEEQIAFIRDWMTDGVELLVDHPLPVGEEWWALRFHDWHDLLDAEDFDLPERLAELMGLTLDGLVEAVLDGQSLAEIAEANGVDAQAVKDFLVAEAEAELDEALAAGYLSEEQAEVLRGWIEDGVELVVDNSLVFPNGFEVLERLGGKFGAHLGEMDWQKWADFDWSEFIGQDPLSVAAETIGVSRGELLKALIEGQSLAEVAEAHGADPQAMVDAQAGAIEGLLDDLAAEGLIPADVPDFVRGHLDEGMQMFAEHGFPFTEHWGEMHEGWAPWGDEGAPWLKHWFNCCPCDDVEGGE
jgi:uncharacterized protein YidB (DUF937 family)